MFVDELAVTDLSSRAWWRFKLRFHSQRAAAVPAKVRESQANTHSSAFQFKQLEASSLER
jgi:hypothetical protein